VTLIPLLDPGKVPTQLLFTMDPCPYLVKYSLDVLKKKTKVLGIFKTDKNVL
jgi:hypothetical protein